MVSVEHRHTATGLYGQLVADGQGYYVVRVKFDGLVAPIGSLAARQEALG